MPQGRVAAAVSGALLTSAGASLFRVATAIWLGAHKRYHPEDHYMRGPGPKWREKHGLHQADFDFAGPTE